MQYLNNCSCCEGLSTQTPVRVHNRPGLHAIAYRVGTHPQFRQSLLARLSSKEQKALRTLTTRDNDDFTISLLDAWATVSDVLTFYQERIANESYLRTATERFPVLELARLIGYELRPGVAASTYLAFTVEEPTVAFGPVSMANTVQTTPVEQTPVPIDPGTRVQSVPAPGEQAQLYETIEKIEARAAWNTIKPRMTQPQSVTADSDSVMLKGTNNKLKPGDVMLIRLSGVSTVRRILKVIIDEEAKTTKVDFVSEPSVLPQKKSSSLSEGNISDYIQNVTLGNKVIQDVINRTWKGEDLTALIRMKNWQKGHLFASVAKTLASLKPSPATGVFIFRKRAFFFGYNAIRQVTYTGPVPNVSSQWQEWDLKENAGEIFLDNDYEEILPDSFVAIQKPNESIANANVYDIQQAVVRSRTAYGMSGKTTFLTLSEKKQWWDSEPSEKPDKLSAIREITVYAQSELLELADLPIEDLVEGNEIILNRLYLDLKVGQKVVITGERSDLSGVISSEIKTLREVVVEEGFTVLTFDESLSNAYLRNSVTINANVVLATHGETVRETLGSGDASKAFQRFVLRQPPLTHVSGATPSGTETTLEIRVNDLLWQEVSSFLGHGPEERIYVTRLDDEGKTTVIFGNGETGARLPTGQENVQAKYRRGIGLGGLVKANQLSQLVTRPLGVKGVSNPIASSGAADRENLEEARRNAPLTVLTLDRVVSLQDYEDFARAFAGIDKALATWTWCGLRRCVYITVAGPNGDTVEHNSTLYKNLIKAILSSGDPHVLLTVESYRPIFFQVAAKIQINPDYLAEKVLSAVEQQLRESFSFSAREFGQPVTYSEVVSVIQNISGVKAVDLDQLFRTDESDGLKQHLHAEMPRSGGEEIFAAELLMLDPRPVNLNIML